MTAASDPDRARRAGRARSGPRRPRRAGHGPRAMGGGRTRLRLDLRLPAAGRRNLHHLHLSRRVRLLLRAGRAGLLHSRLRLARLRDRLFPAARRSGATASQHGLHSQPDFFVRKYASPSLGVLVSIVDLVALIPYLVLQLTGLGIIVTAASYGAIPRSAAIWIGAAIVTVYVMTSGIRGSAYTAVVKDVLILGVVLFLGIYLPLHLYGGIGADVRADRRRQARLPCLPGERAERRLVHLHRAPDRGRLLHVAAILRRRLLGEERARLPAQCDRLADLSAHPAVRVLRRLRRGAASARTEGGGHQSRAVQAGDAAVPAGSRRPDRRRGRLHRAGPGLADRDDRGDAAFQEPDWPLASGRDATTRPWPSPSGWCPS